ncbi:MAG: hypothetical protein INR73_01920 [Williamsia sp.]|nr:hypothetical protein [Williamsia sp.]
MNPPVELHIEELVLHGFTGHDAYRVGGAVEQQISQLLQERGLPSSFSHGAHIDHLHGGSFTMQQGMKDASVGTRIAQSVYKGLAK